MRPHPDVATLRDTMEEFVLIKDRSNLTFDSTHPCGTGPLSTSLRELAPWEIDLVAGGIDWAKVGEAAAAGAVGGAVGGAASGAIAGAYAGGAGALPGAAIGALGGLVGGGISGGLAEILIEEL